MKNKYFRYLVLFLLSFLFMYLIKSNEKPEQKLIEKHLQEGLVNPSFFIKGFSNFGLWEHIDLAKINDLSRLESQKSLYRYVLDHLELYNDDKILEVGVGQGLGAKIIDEEYASDTYVGMDESTDKIVRLKKINHELLKSEKTYRYAAGKAEKLPFETHSFSKLFSVQSPQNFYSLASFINEADRVLKQNGKIVITTSLAKGKKNNLKLKDYTKDNNVYISFNSIDEARAYLKNNGFVDIHFEAIGKYVFEGFDKWLSQTKYIDSDLRNWKKAYNDNLIDYYVISAYKPVELIKM